MQRIRRSWRFVVRAWKAIGHALDVQSLWALGLGKSVVIGASVVISTFITMITVLFIRIPWYYWILIVFGLALICMPIVRRVYVALVRVFSKELTRPSRSLPTLPASQPMPPLSTAEQEVALVVALKVYATELSRVDITFAAWTHHPFAERLVDIFRLAGWTPNGWEPNTTMLPFEDKTGYTRGIDASGYNSVIVNGVASSLRANGIDDVGVTMRPNTMEPSNPKYPVNQRVVYIKIGHTPQLG